MDVPADIHLTRGDTSQKLQDRTTTETFTVDRGRGAGNDILPNEDPIIDNIGPSSLRVHPSLVANSSDVGDHEKQSPLRPVKVQPRSQTFKSICAYMQYDQELPDGYTTGNETHDDESRTRPKSNFGMTIQPTVSEEVSPSDCTVVLAGQFTSPTNFNDLKADTVVQQPPLLFARTVSAATTPPEREVESVDRLACSHIPHLELDRVHSADLAHITAEEQTREEFDYPYGDLPSSQPPSSSPPQLFSSSPCASSQSVGETEYSKMMPAVGMVDCASPRPHGDHVASAAQDDCCLETKQLQSDNVIDVTVSPEVDEYCLRVDPTSCTDDNVGPFRKRINPGEPHGPQPIKRKRSRSNSGVYLPPVPKRATQATQNRQFKKLAAPFRPPSRLSVVPEEPTPTTRAKETASTIGTAPEVTHDKIKEPTRHKASRTSRSITQFKSPLVNRVLPADSHTVRLTPAVQGLERKLQLLKRAVKVKEDREEEVLARLATKWIDAGREVAYEVWDSTKDAGGFDGKATPIRGSYGWESTNNGNMSWGWDNKTKDASDESCDLNSSAVSRSSEQLAREEDEDAGRNTLGAMLRQLGIAPEILGWDDDKETFSD